MKGRTIQRILEGTYADPDGGPPLSVPTHAVAIEPSLAGTEAELVASLGFGRTLAVVSDPTTRAVLGARVERALASIARVLPVVLPDHPHADVPTAEVVRRASAAADALIAVGAGTLNDLCKYAAARDDKPYAVFGTAPSMNGYTSVNASITVGRLKRTLPAAGARGVFLDLGVLAAAPLRMRLSGFGDSVCRSTAQADWLLAHLLAGRPYREAPFVLLAEDEEGLFAEPEALLRGDLEAVARLARTLVLSGFGMSIAGGSQPASQAEHLISHYVDMLGAPELPEAMHGERIGVTTLTMARLQERLLGSAFPEVRPTTVRDEDILAHFGPELGPACCQEFAPKRLDAAAAGAQNDRLAARGEEIRARVAAVTRPSATIERALRRAGAATSPGDLHLPLGFYGDAVRHARELRDRYTFLDLAGDAGLLDALVVA